MKITEIKTKLKKAVKENEVIYFSLLLNHLSKKDFTFSNRDVQKILSNVLEKDMEILKSNSSRVVDTLFKSGLIKFVGMIRDEKFNKLVKVYKVERETLSPIFIRNKSTPDQRFLGLVDSLCDKVLFGEFKQSEKTNFIAFVADFKSQYIINLTKVSNVDNNKKGMIAISSIKYKMLNGNVVSSKIVISKVKEMLKNENVLPLGWF